MIYDAPPTVAGFMNSSAFCRLIMGPVGSGKSTGCLMEVIKRAQQQTPGPDGVRRTRFAIVRATLQQIKLTVLKEFYTWVAPVTDFKVSESTIHLKWRDIVSEIHLIPLDDERDQQRLLSAQLTGIWCNEFPEIDPGLFPAMAGRVGSLSPSRRRRSELVRHHRRRQLPHRGRRVARASGAEPAARLGRVEAARRADAGGGESRQPPSDAGDDPADGGRSEDGSRRGAPITSGWRGSTRRHGEAAMSTPNMATTRQAPRSTRRPSSCTGM